MMKNLSWLACGNYTIKYIIKIFEYTCLCITCLCFCKKKDLYKNFNRLKDMHCGNCCDICVSAKEKKERCECKCCSCWENCRNICVCWKADCKYSNCWENCQNATKVLCCIDMPD